MNRGRLVKIAKGVGIWLPTLFLAWVFLMQGAAKFSSTSGWTRAFEAWGYPDWFRWTVGFMELLAAAFLLLPRTAAIGALIIIVVMLGGIGTHIAAADRFWFRSELVPILFASFIVLVRRAELRSAIQMRMRQA